MRTIKRLSQRGDTILEVLIAIAVLSLVLTLSLALTSRSTQGNRQAQERGEGAKHAESQIEQLKTYISQTATPNLPVSGSKFCMTEELDPDDPSKTILSTATITGNVPANIDLQFQQDPDFNTFDDPSLADCRDGEFFRSYIERNGDTFTAHTRWVKVGGSGIDEATMIHRIYPDLASGNQGGSTATPGCDVNEGMNQIGGCVPCPNGYSSPGGTTPFQSCTIVKPKIIANVTRLRPPPNNTTPPCTSGIVDNKAGINVNLNKIFGGGFIGSQLTDSFSNATFSDLEVFTGYNATVPAPNGYKVCDQFNVPQNSVTKGVTTFGPGPSPGVGTERTVTFKIQPQCTQIPVYGWVDFGSWHDHWRVDSTWWEHTGPDWGPWGPPATNPRYGIGSGKSYPTQYIEGNYPYRTLYVFSHFETQGGWYNRYTERQVWVFDFWHWHSNWQQVVVGQNNVCPS